MTTRLDVRGRLVLDDRIVVGRLAIDDGRITAVDIDDESPGAVADMPFVTLRRHFRPRTGDDSGFCDSHGRL